MTDEEELLLQNLLEDIRDEYTPEQYQGIADALACGEPEIALRQLRAVVVNRGLQVDSKYSLLLR